MKRDIRKEIQEHKYKSPAKLNYWFYNTVMRNVSKKYNCHYEYIDKISDCEGPCIVIFNHLSRLDHLYVIEASYPKRVNMVAGYNEFFRSHLNWAFTHINIIPKKQYTPKDVFGLKVMMSILKKGGSFAFAPEGLATNDGMNKPIVPGTGHLLKHFNVPVYFVELHGQYLQNTKVCLDERYGETYAKVQLLFSKDDLAKYKEEEIDDIINTRFRVDEYAWQKERKIKWDTKNNICSHLEDLIFTCPKCGKRFTMVGEGNRLYCKECNESLTMDDYYEFHKENEDSVLIDSPSSYMNKQRIDIIKEIRQDKNYSYKERVNIGLLPNDHLIKDKKTSEIVGTGLFTIDHYGVHYKDDVDSKYDFDINYNNIYTVITEWDSSYINIYNNGEYTDIFPLERRSSLFMSALIEEMHRLHVNFYKNFKWNDYMYEGLNYLINKKYCS